MNPNNYKNLELAKFIEIIEGRNQYYSQPQRANPLAGHKTYNQALIASGLEPDCTIYLPTWDERQRPWREQFIYMGGYSNTNRPDPNEPFVYRVETPVWWNRGMNTSTGEGPKPELNCNIDLQNCEFNGTLSIFSVRSKAAISVRSCSFLPSQKDANDSGLNITSSKFKEVNIIDELDIDGEMKFPIKTVKINDLDADKLLISGMEIDELYILGKKSCIKELVIFNCEINAIYISASKFEMISISNTSINNILNLSSDVKSFILTGRTLFDKKTYIIQKLVLNFSEQSTKGEFFIRDTNIQQLDIGGDNNSKVVITDSDISRLDINYLTNNGELRLHNIPKINRFSIKDSSLGKAEFFNLGISAMTFMEIIASNLIDIVLINTIFPKQIRGKSQEDYKEIRETFRQLKYASAKQGDRIQELRYEALEMNAFQKDNQFNKTFSEKTILLVNKITNDHGQSWLRAFGLLIFFTALMFFLIKYTMGYVIVLGAFDSNVFSEYLEFAINPLHDFDKVFKNEKDLSSQTLGLVKIYDFVSKLFSGIILFQLIRAFRKYVRSDAG